MQRKNFLINPITRQIREVPVPPFVLGQYSYTVYGLGYDSGSDDYKIVALSCRDSFDAVHHSEYEDTCVNVYSIINGTWKKAGSSLYDHVDTNIPGLFLDGCIHWLARKTTDKLPVVCGV